MKNLFKKSALMGLLFVATSIYSQVGIGTTTPGASLHVLNNNNDTHILKITGNDTTNKLTVKENGEIEIAEPLVDEASEMLLTIDNFNIIRSRDINNIKPTGLEKINEGYGDGWRLIGRNPSNYSPIGFQAIDFSYSTNSGMGASGNYAFIGAGLNNKALSNTNNNLLILGGNNNFIDQDGGSSNNFGVSIIGGNNNVAFSNSYTRNLIFGENNKFEKAARGIALGDNNNLFTDTEAQIIGNNNIVQSKNNTLIIGDNNATTKDLFDVGILGNSNQIGMYVTSKGEHGGFAFGTNNRNESGKSFLIGKGNIGRQAGHRKYSFLIGLDNYNQNAMPSFLFGNQLNNRIPFNVVVGQYNELLTSSHPPTEVAYEVDDLSAAYYNVTNDPAFVVGIGFRDETTGIITRKDGFRVYKNGKVEIKQIPNTNNTLDQLYVRDIDGSFALKDANSLSENLTAIDTFTGTIDTVYLNTTYSTVGIGYNVFSSVSNTMYVKISSTNWISYNTTLVP